MTRRTRTSRDAENRLAELEAQQSEDPQSFAELILAEATDREEP